MVDLGLAKKPEKHDLDKQEQIKTDN